MKIALLLLLFISQFNSSSPRIVHTSKEEASKFINSLSNDQYDKVVFPFHDNTREIWTYLPGEIMWRPGLKLSELSDYQTNLLFNLLNSSLSETGYRKVKQIIELENVLAELENDYQLRNADNYFVSFNGDPTKDSIWAWSFEGHHLSLKFTITPNGTSVTPRFMGANPATIMEGNRKGERTLSKEEDYGIQLIQSMSSEQKQIAVFQDQPYFDIVTQNASEVSPLKPVGILMKKLDKTQRKILEKLIYEYLATLPSELAEERLNKIMSDESEEIRFGWAGSLEKDKGHYYRIQGKSFLIEFDNFLSNANHIHTVWREFDGDFGRDLIRDHYKSSKHHNQN